jgi:tRNA A37 methylthiotransferase MiaB
LVLKIREKNPDINLSTDVIVGFPGETKKQFKNTEKLFEEVKFSIAYISKYSKRKGTAASKLPDNISLEEKKRREKILRKLQING